MPTDKESSEPDAQDMPRSFYLQAHLPGTLGATVRVDLVSLGAGGKEMPGLGDPQATLTDLPKVKLEGTTDGVELKRLSENPWEEGYNLYLSKEIAAIADVRAARAYHRSSKEDDDCTRCDDLPEKALQILSGDSLAVRFPEALRTQLQPIYEAEILDQSQISIASVRWETIPAVRQEPTLNSSHGQGDAYPGTLLHSGELTLQQTDLFLKGRGFDLAFTRVYRSQTIGAGPLGPGWDFSYDQRLRELPNGDVEFYDGTGRRELFEKQEDDTLQAPTGRFVTLERAATGWILVDARHNLARFDRYGRLTAISDAVKDADDTGNEMLFAYDLSSRLIRITDTLKRVTLLGYDDKGRLEKIEDPTGREVTYEYDTDGRLQKVHSPKIETGQSQFSEGLLTRYAYETANGELDGGPQPARRRDEGHRRPRRGLAADPLRRRRPRRPLRRDPDRDLGRRHGLPAVRLRGPQDHRLRPARPRHRVRARRGRPPHEGHRPRPRGHLLRVRRRGAGHLDDRAHGAEDRLYVFAERSAAQPRQPRASHGDAGHRRQRRLGRPVGHQRHLRRQDQSADADRRSARHHHQHHPRRDGAGDRHRARRRLRGGEPPRRSPTPSVGRSKR